MKGKFVSLRWRVESFVVEGGKVRVDELMRRKRLCVCVYDEEVRSG